MSDPLPLGPFCLPSRVWLKSPKGTIMRVKVGRYGFEFTNEGALCCVSFLNAMDFGYRWRSCTCQCWKPCER